MLEWLSQNLPFFLAVLALLFGASSWFARWQQMRGRMFGKFRTATISWLGSYTEGFQRSLDMIPALGASLIDADPTRGRILAGTGLNMKSWGTTIRIDLLTQEGVTFVTMQAGPSASLLDCGESQRLLNVFLQTWEQQSSPIASQAPTRKV